VVQESGLGSFFVSVMVSVVWKEVWRVRCVYYFAMVWWMFSPVCGF